LPLSCFGRFNPPGRGIAPKLSTPRHATRWGDPWWKCPWYASQGHTNRHYFEDWASECNVLTVGIVCIAMLVTASLAWSCSDGRCWIRSMGILGTPKLWSRADNCSTLRLALDLLFLVVHSTEADRETQTERRTM
jgi:hypothetical protein